MSQTQPPEGVLDPKQPWFPGKVGEKTWIILKAKLTGGEAFGTGYSSTVNLTSADADKLIKNLKKDPRGYPQFNSTGGALEYENLQKYQGWLKEEYLEKPSGKQVDTNVGEIPEAASLKITAKTSESRIKGSAESLMSWTRVPGKEPMPLEQALTIVRGKGARLDPWKIPELDMDAASNDAAMGRSTPATEAVAAAYRQFYGLAVPPSAGTETATDTRVKQPPAAPTPTPSATTETATDTRVKQPTTAKEKKKNNLKPKPYAKTNIERWSKLTGYELDSLSDYTRDQLRALSVKYGIKNASRKTGEEVIKLISESPDYIKAAPKTVEKKIEKVSLPKPAEQSSDIKIPQAHYIQGQRGRWEPEFENDIDHAAYYAGKSPIPKGDKQKEVLAWLKSLGLTYEQIHDHREKVLEKMRDTIAVPGADEQYPYVYIDAVDQDFVVEDEEEEDESEYDDLYGSSVDDLISSVQVEEEPSADEQEVNAQATVATEVLTEAEDAREQEIDESILDDFPEELRNSLTGFINKRTGKTSPTTEKKSTSSYVSNNKIFKFLTNNIFKIQGQLDSINKSIQNQTELIRANLELTASVHENLNIQNDILARKLDAILEAIDGRKGLTEKFADDEENRLAEARLESGMDVAGTETATDTRGGKKSSGNSLLRRLIKFFGRKLASKLWKTLVPKAIRSRLRLARRALGRVKRIPSRLAAKLASKIAPKVVQKTAQNVATTVSTRAVAKGFEHIALPGVTKAAQQADAPAARAITKSGNIFQRALSSPVIQKALVKTLGKEGAEKLTVKLAAKLIPGVGTAYGLGEGLARIAMGDVKGGFLSFGSAIPVGGVAFAAVDILRDINTDAYTRHIESNLPTPSDQNFAAFFADALGVTEDQYETGGETNSSKTVMLHGTELLSTPQSQQAGATQAVDPIGGTIVATTTKFINAMGPAAASVAPMFEQAAAPLAKIYDIPSVLVQTNIGGAFPSMQATLSKAKEKRKMTPGEELSGIERDLLETQDPQSFADKLLKMLDPEGKFQQLLQQLNNPTVPPGGAGGEVSAEPFVLLSGDHDISGEPGLDFVLKGTQNRAVLAGTVIDIGHQFNRASNKGYGNFIIVQSTNPLNGDKIDMLYAHFPKGEIKVKKGDQVSVGQDLGRMATREEFNDPKTRPEVGSGSAAHTSLDFFKSGTNQQVDYAKHVELSDYILKELRKGPDGAIEKARQQAYQQQQAQPPGATPVGKPIGVTTNEISKLSDTRDPTKLILGAGHQGPGGKGTASGGVAEHQATAHMLRAIQGLVKQDPDLADKIGFESFTNNNFARDNMAKNTNKGRQFIELHFDQYGGGGRSGVIPSRNARAGVTGNAGTSSFDVALSRHFGNYGANFKERKLGIPDTGGSILEFGAIDSNQALLKEIKSGIAGPETMKLAQYTHQALREGAKNEGWLSPPTQRQPAQSKYYLKQGGDKKADTQIVMIPAASSAGKSIEKNATVEGQRFTYNRDYNAFQTQEIPSATRALLLRRLGLN